MSRFEDIKADLIKAGYPEELATKIAKQKAGTAGGSGSKLKYFKVNREKDDILLDFADIRKGWLIGDWKIAQGKVEEEGWAAPELDGVLVAQGVWYEEYVPFGQKPRYRTPIYNNMYMSKAKARVESGETVAELVQQGVQMSWKAIQIWLLKLPSGKWEVRAITHSYMSYSAFVESLEKLGKKVQDIILTDLVTLGAEKVKNSVGSMIWVMVAKKIEPLSLDLLKELSPLIDEALEVADSVLKDADEVVEPKPKQSTDTTVNGSDTNKVPEVDIDEDEIPF